MPKGSSDQPPEKTQGRQQPARTVSSAAENNSAATSAPSPKIISASRRISEEMRHASPAPFSPRPLARWPGVRIDGDAGQSFTLVRALAYQDISLLQVSPQDILAKISGYQIVGEDTQVMTFSNEYKPVVVNDSNHRLGIVTGTYIVQFKTDLEAGAFAQNHRLQLLSSDASLRMAFFQPMEESRELLPLLEQIKADLRVTSARLEIIQSEKRTSP